MLISIEYRKAKAGECTCSECKWSKEPEESLCRVLGKKLRLRCFYHADYGYNKPEAVGRKHRCIHVQRLINE